MQGLGLPSQRDLLTQRIKVFLFLFLQKKKILPTMIDKFTYLLALSREKHFGRAAESCGITQPTLSASIKQLENTLGALLVRRGARFIGFTPEGDRALDTARRVLSDVNLLREDLRNPGTALTGHLRIHVIPTALPLVARLTTPIAANNPGLRFTVRAATSVDVLAALDTLAADAGITYLADSAATRFSQIPLARETYCLLIDATAAAAQHPTIGWDGLHTLRLGLLSSDMQNRRIIEARLQAAGVAADPVLESNSLLVLLAHVRSGLCSSVLPALVVETLGLPANLRAIPITEAQPPPLIGLAYPPHAKNPPALAELLVEAERMQLR